MDVFHGNLEAIKTLGLGELNLSGKVLAQIFINNAITHGKEGKDAANKMVFLWYASLEVLMVISKVDFFSHPEACLCLLVFLKKKFMSAMAGEEDMAVCVGVKKWLKQARVQ